MNIVEKLRAIRDHDWRVSFLAHTSDTAGEAADHIEALTKAPEGVMLETTADADEGPKLAAAREKVADWQAGEDAEYVYTEEMVECLMLAAMDDRRALTALLNAERAMRITADEVGTQKAEQYAAERIAHRETEAALNAAETECKHWHEAYTHEAAVVQELGIRLMHIRAALSKPEVKP